MLKNHLSAGLKWTIKGIPVGVIKGARLCLFSMAHLLGDIGLVA